MKKTLLLLASVALLLVGCAKEQLSNGLDGGLTNVTFTASVDGGVATKAVAHDDGNGAFVNRCIMEIYFQDQLYTRMEAAMSETPATTTFANVPVVAGKQYKVLFWADHVDNPEEYITTDKYYDTRNGLKAVQIIKESFIDALEDEDPTNDYLDAFFGADDYTVGQTTNNSFNITLYRPFAQLNVITTDVAEGKTVTSAALLPDKVSVSYKADNTINVATGETSKVGQTEAEYTFAYVAPVYGSTTDWDAVKTRGELTLSMDYILASTEQGTVDVTFKTFNNGDANPVMTHSLANLPYKRNYRTNVKGDLLTVGGTWTATVNSNWTGENPVNFKEVDNISSLNTSLAAGANNLKVKLPSDSDGTNVTFTSVNNTQDVILDFVGTLGNSKTLTFVNASGATGPKSLNITAPAGTSLVFEQQQNHVVINGTSYASVQGAFSANTLVISKGVTVTTLTITAGGLEIHGTVTAINADKLTDNVKVRACEGLSSTVFDALKGHIDTPEYKAVQNGEAWDIVPADKTATIGETVYYNLPDALGAAKSGDEIKLLIDLENAGTNNLPAGVTFNGCGHKITDASALYINTNGGVVKNVVFENIHNDTNKQSPVYAYSLAGKAEISGCTFDDCDWDAIQITTNSANADVVIKDNVFKAVVKENKQNRFIHIQTDGYSNVDMKVAVTGNKFEGIYNLKNCAVELYCPTDFNKVNISGNYLDDEKISVCIANKENNAWKNHVDAATGWLNANGQAVAINAAIGADVDCENTLLCTTLAVALQESAYWTGNLCIMNETALRELSTLVNGGTSFAGKKVSLLNDIDLNNVPFTPIGRMTDRSFAGCFDGKGHTIQNLKVESTVTGAALFGYLAGNKVDNVSQPMLVNLTLKNIDIASTKNAAAFVAYDGDDCGIIDNCHVDGGTIVSIPHAVSGGFDDGDKVGGIAGQLYGGHTISNCSVKNLSITAYRDLGGIIGHPYGECTIFNNVVENVTIIQSSKNAYKDEVITTVGEIAGRSPECAKGSNSTTSVSIITQPVDGYTYYQNEKRHEISSVVGLKYFSDQVNKGENYEGHTVKLTKDIDLDGETWIPAANTMSSYPGVGFFGTFDGQNHIISNMTCSANDPKYAAAGFIGAGHCTIKDLTLKDVNVTSTHYAGAFVGYASSAVILNNCKLIGGKITSTPELIGTEYDNGDKAGGLVGYASDDNGGLIDNCSVENVEVRAYRDLGGIAGAFKGAISNCTVKNTTIIQDNTNGYKDSIDTYHEILGRDLGATLTNNTSENVTVKSEN